jgi:hypothetical protein
MSALSQGTHALVHFRRSFVGEGHRQDTAGGYATSDKFRDAIGYNASLAGPGTRQNEKWPCRRHHGVLLRRIQSVEHATDRNAAEADWKRGECRE